MKCQDVQPLLSPLADRELAPDLETQATTHLQGCPQCSIQLKSLQTMSHDIKSAASALSYRAPAGLLARVQAPPQRHPVWERYHRSLPRLLVAASILVLVTIGSLWYRMSGDDSQEVLAAHLHSLQASHLMDVASTDQHTVKPWFAGKLDFSPPVVDLAAEGFPLKGGRLDYLKEQTVAALIYQRNLHVINVFVWPSGAPSAPVAASSVRGYHLMRWAQGGMQAWAVSDLNPVELQQFVDLLRGRWPN